MTTEIVPFRGIAYNAERLSGEEVIAPPYDVISAEMREALYAKGAHNIIKVDAGLDLPGDSEAENKYTRASAYLDAWLADGVLQREEAPAYYACALEYEMAGRPKRLTGLFALVRLVELGEGVYPHEATHSKPKKDRLSLMHHTGANTSPIYSLVSGGKSALPGLLEEPMSELPYMHNIDPDGTRHMFWPVRDEAHIEAIRSALSDVSVFIADGHHRYETALEYQRQMRERDGEPKKDMPYDFVLMFLADIDDPGLTVLPTHRMITVDAEGLKEKLEKHFTMESLAGGADIMKAIEGRERAFGLYDGNADYVITCRGECTVDAPEALTCLDVVLLHKMIFGQLLEVGGWGYEMDPLTARRYVDDGEYDAAFFLNPTKVGDVERVALGGLRMPPKSTYFYPKIQTGFVINDLKSF